MSTLGGFYINAHRTQYDGVPHNISAGCTWTSLANGADAATGGRVSRTPSQVHALVPNDKETNPATPGWSIPDAVAAAAKLGVPLLERTGRGWAAVVDAWNRGLEVLLQGDSDQFGDGTCSGKFNGDHALVVHPAFRIVDGRRQRWIDDPICPTGRWEYESVLRAYAAKLSAGIRVAIFTTPVPKVTPPAPAPAPTTVTLRYGGARLNPRQVRRIAVPAGRRANARARPTSAAKRVTTLANGAPFTAYQRTTTGQLLAGSRVWFGDRTGARWLHVSAF